MIGDGAIYLHDALVTNAGVGASAWGRCSTATIVCACMLHVLLVRNNTHDGGVRLITQGRDTPAFDHIRSSIYCVYLIACWSLLPVADVCMLA